MRHSPRLLAVGVVLTVMTVTGSALALAERGPLGLIEFDWSEPTDPVAAPQTTPDPAHPDRTPASEVPAPAVPDPSSPHVPDGPSLPPTPTERVDDVDDEAPVEDPTHADRTGDDEGVGEEPPTEAPNGPVVDVAAVQQRLQELGYYRGPVDDTAGPATTSAVMAFQKVNDLAVDGVVGPITLAALDDPAAPDLVGGAATRIEVDLTAQVVHVVDDGAVVATLPASSGNGETYRTASGGTARARTPVGAFEVERRIRGVREAPLGTLYDPLYFHRGWALHGSNHVPAYPASHGCVRLTRWDATWLFERTEVGTPVIVHGGTHVFTP